MLSRIYNGGMPCNTRTGGLQMAIYLFTDRYSLDNTYSGTLERWVRTESRVYKYRIDKLDRASILEMVDRLSAAIKSDFQREYVTDWGVFHYDGIDGIDITPVDVESVEPVLECI